MGRNRRKQIMPSNNSKYTEEFRVSTAKHILDNQLSASAVAEEMGIDKNTVCSWVRAYRRAHNMPSYAEERGYHTPAPADQKDWKARAMAAEVKLKEKEKELAKERKRRELEEEKVEILKKSLHIFMQPHE